MRVVVTGATGSIGRRLVPALVARGNRVAVISRQPRGARAVFGGDVEIIAGDPSVPGPWQQCMHGAHAVVHLAGAGIADRRWSRAYRAVIERSRVDSTHQVVNAIDDAGDRPAVLVSASATGFYGDTRDETVTERFPAGKGFLADVCVRWEEEAKKAAALGVRVVQARIGMVLDEEGPALATLMPWFRAMLGATVGDGRQWMPWIWQGDCVNALIRCVDRATLVGPVNLTAPEPCTQRTFAKALGRALGRPVLLRAPWWALRLGYGALADELFRSQRVVPKALLDDGYQFEAASIDAAMDELARDDAPPVPSRPTRAPAAAVAAELPKLSRPSVRPRLLIVSRAAIERSGLPLPHTREAVRIASSRGCAVVVAAGTRGPATGQFLVDPLLYPIAIVANGAVLWNHRDGRAVYAERLEQTILAGLTLGLREKAPRAELVFEGDDWIAGSSESTAELGQVALRLAPGELPPKPVARLHVIGDAETIADARRVAEPFWRERRVSMVTAGPTHLSIAAPLVDRAVAAQRIARRLGATRDETMAVVACDDDLGLTDWCGFAVATADAPLAIRRLAAAVVPVGAERAEAGDPADPSLEPLMTAVRRFVTE